MRQHVIAFLVENKPGVLGKITHMFRRRNFNIESISVGVSEVKGFSRITVALYGDDWLVEQVIKQLKKIIEVVRVTRLDLADSVIRELVLIKVNVSSPTTREEIMQYVKVFRAAVVDIEPNSIIIEITGDSDKVNAFIDLMRNFGIKELSRTGITALSRGKRSLNFLDEKSEKNNSN